MKLRPLVLFAAASAALTLSAGPLHRVGWRPPKSKPATFTADRIAVDNVTKAAVATGHVHAVAGVLTLRSEHLERDEKGTMSFSYPTCATTCTNDVGHTHWNVTGEVKYRADDYVLLRNAWLRFWEVPIFYLPYLYYPLDTESGFRWMPGYTSKWGGFLLTRTSYQIAGDPLRRDNTYWLKGETALDLRTKNGVAIGEELWWNLGDFGAGSFRWYQAWDMDVDTGDKNGTDHDAAWGSTKDENRYGITMSHRWNPTERDTVFVRAAKYSDSYFRQDFMRKSFLEIRSQWMTYESSGVMWEHNENAFAVGAEVSGRLDDFYGMSERLPEFYLDYNPAPVFGLPVNYESENRIGWLDRRYAEYGCSSLSPFAANPGVWADYDTFRLDTYHRLTAPFQTFDDVLSVVPRLAYRGTYWSESGVTDLTGWNSPSDAGSLFRSIGEAGVTFAGRGTAWISDEWQHMVEPYLDVLVQEAWYTGDDDNNRPYVFDNIDASRAWEDQFAGRGRNLPYSYYGFTPGLRNDWSKLDDRGHLRKILDFDAYAAFSFDTADFASDSGAEGRSSQHKLAHLGDRNYGRNDVYVSPGFRVRWTPSDDISLMTRVEYDPDYNKIALADFGWRQRVTKKFSYNLLYSERDARYWDFSSTPFSSRYVKEDELNSVKYNTGRIGFQYDLFDWLAFSPYVRWDFDESELDCVGGWVDYMTDCLGFRFLVEYQNSVTRIDRYEYDDDWNFGFYIYLRAFGAQSGDLFSAK